MASTLATVYTPTRILTLILPCPASKRGRVLLPYADLIVSELD